MVVGMAGGVFFLVSCDFLLRSLHYLETSTTGVYALGIDFQQFDAFVLYVFMTFPYAVLFILGAGILRLMPLARKIRAFFLPSFVCIDGTYFVYVNYAIFERSVNWRPFLLLFLPLIAASLFGSYYLTRPKVKEQFK